MVGAYRVMIRCHGFYAQCWAGNRHRSRGARVSTTLVARFKLTATSSLAARFGAPVSTRGRLSAVWAG